MPSVSASVLTSTPGLLGSTAVLRQCLRQIGAAGPKPGRVDNASPGRSDPQRPDLGGLRAVRENALRFWRQQENPLSLLTIAPRPKPSQIRPLYVGLPLPPSSVFALARTGPWCAPPAAPPPKVVGVMLKPHAPELALEAWLSEHPIPLHRDTRHPLGLISLHGLPLLERNICQGDQPWPHRTAPAPASCVAPLRGLWP